MASVASSQHSNMPKRKISAFDTGSPRNPSQKTSDLEEVASNVADDVESQAETNGEDIQIEDVGAADGEEVVPLGSVNGDGSVVDHNGNILGKVEGDAIEGSMVDSEGDVIDAEGNVIGSAKSAKGVKGAIGDAVGEALNDTTLDLSMLEGKTVNKLGKIVDEKGTPVGQIIEGDPKKLSGKQVDKDGKIWDNAGKVIGRAEPLPDTDDTTTSAPFEDFPESVIDIKGNVIFQGRIVGKLLEGDSKKLEGKKVDADGDILDKHGNILGKAERFQEEEEEQATDDTDRSILEGKKVNKGGNVVDDNGKLIGRVVDGEVSKLVGKKCDAQGKIWSDSGKVIGSADIVPMDEQGETSDAPFEDFPDAVVDAKGNVNHEGQIVGKLIEGDAKKLAGKKVDKDGEVVDKIGNVLGKAERWTEPDEPEPEAIDNSVLAGKRVNKLGNIVDSNGQIFGRLVEGDPKKLAGRMCDKNGNIMNEMGEAAGKAELVLESEREGEKTGPFADFDNPTVTKDGKVEDAKGTVIGRLIEGDAKKLFGKTIDSDGDVLDKNGNSLGKAERWEEEEKEISKHPAAGRKVNREGNVVDENGDVIAKLTEGEATKCWGKEIDNDGDVVDGKGKSVGHVTLLEDIPAPKETKEDTEEETAKKSQLEKDKKLAAQLATCIEQSVDKIKPILKMITEHIDAAENQPKEELDEEKLVETVKPLLEEGGSIMQECNGAIRALDPDGRIQNQAKHNTASREATPEEHRLAEQLKELTGSVTQTIDQAKKKIAGMPHAKKELNPLWGLLSEPLGQIIAAVGLLLSGVLGLVGRLLSGLGLGGLLDNLLGGLGIKGVLEGLGLGSVTKSLTGKK